MINILELENVCRMGEVEKIVIHFTVMDGVCSLCTLHGFYLVHELRTNRKKEGRGNPCVPSL